MGVRGQDERGNVYRSARLKHRDLEESISRLETVDAVRVVSDGDVITEVHIVAAPSKPAKQVVRDVQSLAMARFGVNIDRRVISVVQIAEDHDRSERRERPVLMRLLEQPNGTRNEVTVTLRWKGTDYVGSSSGPAAATARYRLIGEATLDALGNTFANAAPLALDAIGPAGVGMRTIMIAVVVATTQTGDELAVGSSVASGDEGEAAVRAVLDALNRRLPTLIA